MRESWDEYFTNLCYYVSTRATCPRRQVGSVVVDQNHRIVGTGYNGSEPGADHCLDVGCDMRGDSCVRTTHSEVNALVGLSHQQRAGSTLYCTDFPCFNCASYIARSGVIEVVYVRQYKPQPKSLALFAEHGIAVRNYVPNILLTEA